MQIPVPVLNELKKTTGDLVLSHGAWQMQHISGVGCFKEGSTWKLRIMLMTLHAPPELQQYLNQHPMMTPVVMNETGPFSFLSGSGDGIRAGGNRGTVTAVVQNGGGRFLLSCHHVLDANGTEVQDAAHTPIGKTVDGITFNREPVPADAGIASLDQGVNVTTGLPHFPEVRNTQPVDLESGAHVRHWGEVTHGANSVISTVGVTLKIKMPVAGFVRFSGVALVDANFAQKGDSGSLVIDTDQQRPAGIVFGKAELPGYATRVAICSLGTALARFGVSIV
jgi:hypothetical protein